MRYDGQPATTFFGIPRAKLLFDQPSPIEKLERLTSAVGSAHSVHFWIKREDCNSGLAFGGNKVRKLEYVFPEAISNGCDTIVTVGGIQSNHMRQVAAAAAKHGLRVGQALFLRPSLGIMILSSKR